MSMHNVFCGSVPNSAALFSVYGLSILFWLLIGIAGFPVNSDLFIQILFSLIMGCISVISTDAIIAGARSKVAFFTFLSHSLLFLTCVLLMVGLYTSIYILFFVCCPNNTFVIVVGVILGVVAFLLSRKVLRGVKESE